MAACSQIDHQLQAYLDQELSDSERTILEQHIEECAACRKSLRVQQRTAANLFQASRDHRLSHDLTPSVMENLPEMEAPVVDVVGLNWRAKHPSVIRERLVRFVPVAAAALLVILALVIRDRWPSEPVQGDALGVVAYSAGLVTATHGPDTQRNPVAIAEFVHPESRFETGNDGFLMLRLAADSDITLDNNSRVLVTDERNVRVETGRVLLKVGKASNHYFRVLTPESKVIVFGTVFDVRVRGDVTSVGVQEGKVQVEQVSDGAFVGLRPGEGVGVSAAAMPLNRYTVAAEKIDDWADHIVAEEQAESVYASSVRPRFEGSSVTGEVVYLLDTAERQISAVVLEWDPADVPSDVCGYDIYVYGLYNDRPKSLFKAHVPAEIFADRSRTRYEIANPKPVAQRSHPPMAYIRPMPDESSGKVWTTFKEDVRADFILN